VSVCLSVCMCLSVSRIDSLNYATNGGDIHEGDLADLNKIFKILTRDELSCKLRRSARSATHLLIQLVQLVLFAHLQLDSRID